jgi:hypothetical protein
MPSAELLIKEFPARKQREKRTSEARAANARAKVILAKHLPVREKSN